MSDPRPDEDDALRRAFAHRPSPAVGAEPVDPEALWRAVRGRAEPAEVAALAERMAADPALAEDWRAAAAFAEEAEAEPEHRPDARRIDAAGPVPQAATEPANHAQYTRWGAVVALVAAAVLLVLAWPRGGAKPHVDDPGALRGGQGAIAAVRGDGALGRDDPTLEWSAVPGAVRYELHVSTPELEPVLVERELQATTRVLPAALLRTLPPEGELLWRVEAVLGDERRVVSPTFALTVR